MTTTNEVITRETIKKAVNVIFLSALFSFAFVIFVNYVTNLNLIELSKLTGEEATIKSLVAFILNIPPATRALGAELFLSNVLTFVYYKVELHNFIINMAAFVSSLLIIHTALAIVKNRDIRFSKLTLALAALTIFLYVSSSFFTEPLQAFVLSYYSIFTAIACSAILERKHTKETILTLITHFTLLTIFAYQLEPDMKALNMTAAWENTSKIEIYNAAKELEIKQLGAYDDNKNN